MTSHPHRTAWAVALFAALVLCARFVRSAEAEGDTYRLKSAQVTGGGGPARSAGLKAYQMLAQPEPFGASSATGTKVIHGWRIPEVVAQLWRYALAAGWNLKGAPGVSDRMIGDIFTGPAGAPIKLGNVMYPATDGTTVEADDSDPVLANRAFWVFSYWGGQGVPFATPDAHSPDDGHLWTDDLDDGWNLFSPSFRLPVPERGTIVVVWTWDVETHSYRVLLPGEIMMPLDGYWVFKAPAAP